MIDSEQKSELRKESNASPFAGSRIWITGHRGMVGGALVRSFGEEEAVLLLASHRELDLRNQNAVFEWVGKNRPEMVFHIGARVGGIYANASLPADFICDNLMIQTNVINAAHHFGVKKLIFVASNCVYPEKTAQPIPEDALLKGVPEDNIRSYAIGKLAGIEMCRAFRKQYGCNYISIIPPNLYGPGDHYHPQYSHVVAGILRRAHEAKIAGKKELVVWGDGRARREVLYVDDLADAMKFLMLASVTDDLFNVGCGHDLSVAELANLISTVVGFGGKIVYDDSKPNGTIKKLLDCSRIHALGWYSKTDEKTGLWNAYKDFLAQVEDKKMDV
jgi:GDP-L-fucose synthase